MTRAATRLPARREARAIYLLVFIGSGIGGMGRHGVGVLALRWLDPVLPMGR